MSVTTDNETTQDTPTHEVLLTDTAAQKVRDLLEQVGHSRGNADPVLDVKDPYRRGPEAVAAAAAHLDELLAVAVDRLV